MGEGRKCVREMRKGCEKGEDTPLSNPAKVIFKFTHRTMTSLSIVIYSVKKVMDHCKQWTVKCLR